MNHLPLIIQREYLTKVKNKSFLIMTFLSPILMIGLFTLVGYLSNLNNNKVRAVSVLDESGLLSSVFQNSEKIKYTDLSTLSLEDAKAVVKEQGASGLIYIPKSEDINTISEGVTFYSEDSPSLSLISDLESKIEEKLTNLKRKDLGINTEQLKQSRVSVDIDQESFTGEKTSKVGNLLKLAFGGAAGYLLFMFIIIYGNMIMRSVIEEKTSRIIEVIISSVKPIQLMLGKIIGTSLAGLTQFVIWAILGSILMIAVSAFFGVDVSQTNPAQQELMQEAMQNPAMQQKAIALFAEFWQLPLANLIIAFILFFIGGYLLYSSLYAAIGAAVDNETDTQQFMFPVLMPLMLAVYVGIFTVVEDPHGTVSTVFSLIPFTSPVVMLMRIPFGVPMWQQLLSIVLLIITFLFIIWLAAKIYRVGILMYGKKPSYKELVKWIKY